MRKVLTVSIAAYNVSEFLRGTLDSLVGPNLGSLDVIVVNDGSTDDTSLIAHEYSDRYPDSIRVIDKENGGYGSTHNASLEIARGDYFKFLDGDDWFDADGLSKLVSLLEVTNVDAAISPYVCVYTSEEKSEEMVDNTPELSEGFYNVREATPRDVVAAHSLTYRTDLLRDHNFEMSERTFYTDTEYAYLPWRYIKTYAVMKSPVYRYRLGRAGQSVSREGITAHYPDICRVCSRLLDELSDGCQGKMAPPFTYIWRCLVKEMAVPYRFLCTARPSKEIANKLVEWDGELRKHPSISDAVERSSKLVHFLRFTHMRGYHLAAFIMGRQ